MSAPRDALQGNAPFRVAAVTAVFLATAVLACFNITNLDIGGHLAVGREILKTMSIPDADFFTHTVAGSPYPVHQWLGEVILFGVDYLTGATGLVLLRIGIVLTGAFLIFRNARREDAPLAIVTAIVLVLVVAARPRFFVRPMVVSWIFLPLLHALLVEVRRGGSRRLWPLLPLMTVWGHLHSGVLFGILFLGGTLAGEAVQLLRGKSLMGGAMWRRMALFSAAAAALPFATMAMINPSGLKPLILPLLFFRNDAFRAMIGEYRGVDLLVDWPFGLVAGAVLLGVLLRPRRVTPTDLIITGGFGILAYQAVRGILPFAAVSAPLLARTWGSFAEDAFDRVMRGAGRPRSRAGLANTAEALILVGVVVASLLVSVRAADGWLFPFGFGKDPKHYPEATLNFIGAQGVRGRVFNTDVFASALLWRWRGINYPVFVDARLEAYPEEFWRNEYYRVLEAAPGWEDVLRRRDVQFALVQRSGGKADAKIGEALWDSPEWGLVFWDDHAMIFLRRHGNSRRNDEILARWEFRSFHPRRPQVIQDLRGDALVRAANDLAGIVEWAPDSFVPRWTLAAAWSRLGQGPEAVRIFDELSRRREARGATAFAVSRAEAHLVAGDRAGWAEHLKEADRDPESRDERFAAAALLAVAGRRDEAIAEYRGVLAAFPGDADTMNNLALLLAEEEAGRAEAASLIDRAVEADPGDGYFLASRAEILFRSGDPAAARQDFLRSLELLPEGDEAARAYVGGWLARID